MSKISVRTFGAITLVVASLFTFLLTPGLTITPADARPQAIQLSKRIKIDQGYIQGIEDRDKISYLGVPYAEAPVGDLRFRPTQPPLPFSGGLLQAIKPGPVSLQRSMLSAKKIIGSEDCLYLNVYTPKNAKGRNLPVMVWIHGGAFIIGDGIQKLPMVDVNLYDPTELIRRGEVIVVTFNYRLGPLGFLAHPALLRESLQKDGIATTGNYGIHDQIAVLKWVQKNIRRLGGNPGNVTIFGESAGGNSVKVLVASPLAAGLFTKAIGQSAPFMERPLDLALETGVDVANQYRKTDSRGYSIPPSLSDLRSIPAEELVRDFPIETPDLNSDPRELRTWAPVVDGAVLEAPTLETVRRGRHNRVTYIGGTLKFEMTALAPFFLSKIPLGLSDANYMKVLVSIYGEETASRAFEKYTRREYGSNREAFLMLLSDTTFHSPSVEFINAMEHWNPGSTYRYVMSQKVGMVGATHGFDIPYVFPGPHLLTMNYNPLNPAMSLYRMPSHIRLSNTIVRNWANFAHFGNPNGNPNSMNTSGVVPVWPSVREGGMMEFNSKGSEAVDDFRAEQMEFLSSTTRSMSVNPGAQCEALFLP